MGNCCIKLRKYYKLKEEKARLEAELKPPSYFDLTPFKQAFTNFIRVKPEDRASFR